jgi:hypothetical protein
MYTGQIGLNTSRHTKFPSNASDELRDSESSERSLKRRVSHSALTPEVEDDPIRSAIRATAKLGPVTTSKTSTDADLTHTAMSISEVVAAEEDVDVSDLIKSIHSPDKLAHSGYGSKNRRGRMYMFE